MLYGILSTVVWFLLVLSSVLGYSAYHLRDDLDIESRGVGDIVLTNLQASSAEEEISLNADDLETASIRTFKRRRTGQIHPRSIARIADWLRWIGKSIAVVNAIGIVANSFFQYSGVYDNCFCDSSVYYWGSQAFDIISPSQADIDLAKNGWIGALVLGLGSCGIFVGTIFLVRDSLPS